MRIFYIGWADSAHVARWAGFFAKLGHKVWLLPLRRVLIPGVKVLYFFMANRRIKLQILEAKLYYFLLRVDVVHVHWAGFGYIPCYGKMNPYIVSVWGSEVYRFKEFNEIEQKMIYDGISNASLVTVDSEDMRKSLVGMGIKKDLIKIVQWGVDTDIFRPGLDTVMLRKELCATGHRVIYSPRNLHSVYNLDIILKAFSKVLNHCPDTLLVQKYYTIDKKYQNEYLALAESLGVANSVRLVGDMAYENIPLLYNLADVLVSVPSSDATPVSVLEGMACGVFPIVSDVPSLREWLTDREGCYFVPIKDIDTLSERIVWVLTHKEEALAMCRSNREKVKLRADHRKNMILMDSYYKMVLKNKLQL